MSLPDLPGSGRRLAGRSVPALLAAAIAIGHAPPGVAAVLAGSRCDGPLHPQAFNLPTVSSKADVDAATFSPDGRTVFFDEQAGRASTILTARLSRRGWTPPEAAPFSGQWRDLDPAMAPDGSFLIFSSNRPAQPGGAPLDATTFDGTVNRSMGSQLWRVDRSSRGWSAPVRLPDSVNDGTRIFSASVAGDGSIYFQKPDPVSRTFHLYRSQWRGGRYQAPVPVAIGPESSDERDPAVVADESFLVFSANYRGKGAPNRLQVALRKGHGWDEPVELDAEINREGAEGPHLAPDQCTIYYDRDGRIWRASIGRYLEGRRDGPPPHAAASPIPRLFAPERGWPAGTDTDPAFTPDRSTLFFTHAEGERRTIMIAHQQGRAWSTPEPAPFSGTWRDIEPTMAPDGSYLVFISNRPAVPGGPVLDGYFGGKPQPGKGGALWRVDRKGGGWSEPVRLPAVVNGNPATYSPAVAADGSIYFNRPDPATGKSHIFLAQADGGTFRTPEPLPISDGTIADFDAAIAPDQSFILFSSPRPPARPGTAILFVSYRRSGGWTPPQPLGGGIEGYEARLSPDLATLYFSAAAPEGSPGEPDQNRIYEVPLKDLIDRRTP